MKTPVRLSQKAITALKLIYNTTYKARTRKLEEINEYSFAIILYWNNLEALLKVLQYKRKINEPYPDKLDFISRKWSILKNAYQCDNSKYEAVLGIREKSNICLWGIRDRIAHASYIIDKEEYEKLKSAAIWMTKILETNLPQSYELAHKHYLQHKKKIVSKISI